MDTELQHARLALSAIVAGFAARLDILEREARETQRQLEKLPAQVAWAVRYLSDAEETPEMLTALAAEVAVFKHEHPAEYGTMLDTIKENASACD